MNYFKPAFIGSFLLFAHFDAVAGSEKCDEGLAAALPAEELVKTMEAIHEKLYRPVATMKINNDGQGAISIFYENGVPKAIQIKYKDGKGKVNIIDKEISKIEKGDFLAYPDNSAPALKLSKGPGTFKNGDHYHFNFSVRTELNPDKFTVFPLILDANKSKPKFSGPSGQFNNVELVPQISWKLEWKGTFDKKVKFYK